MAFGIVLNDCSRFFWTVSMNMLISSPMGLGIWGFSGTSATTTAIAATTLYRGCCYFRTRIPRLQLRVETQGLPILTLGFRDNFWFIVWACATACHPPHGVASYDYSHRRPWQSLSDTAAEQCLGSKNSRSNLRGAGLTGFQDVRWSSRASAMSLQLGKG